MISIVNYGMGNIRSIQNALNFLSIDNKVITSPKDVLDSTRLILPGVGSFPAAMDNLARLHLLESLNQAATEKRIPILGICLGMQLLAEFGEEDRPAKGLGWIGGKVTRFNLKDTSLKIPHIGFNTVSFDDPNDKLFAGLGDRADFYFVHSYHIECTRSEDISSHSNYGEKFVSSVRRENIMGTQFHPEKSQSNGLVVLRNFAGMSV